MKNGEGVKIGIKCFGFLSCFRLWSLAVLWFFSISSSAQYDFREIVRIEGLSDNGITALAEDDFGFFWIGTHNGLNKTDGRTVWSYDESNSGFSGRDVSNLVVDHKNQVWIGTVDAGLFRYNYALDDFVRIQDDEMHASDVRALHIDHLGQLWVGTKHALHLYQDSSSSFVSFPSVLSNALVRTISSDSLGTIWVGTSGAGLVEFSPRTKLSTSHFGERQDERLDLRHLAQLPSGDIIVGSRNTGLWRFDKEAEVLRAFPVPDSDAQLLKGIGSIYLDESEIWIGTDGNGVFANKWSHEKEMRGVAILDGLESKTFGNSISAIIRDKNKNIWIGSAWQGLKVVRSRPEEVSYYWREENQNITSIWSIYVQGSKLWMGSHGNGLSACELNQIARGELDRRGGESLQHQSINVIFPKSGSEYWLGTYGSGLLVYDTRTDQVSRFRKGTKTLKSQDVRKILGNKDDGFWVGTWGGGLTFINEKNNEFVTYEGQPNVRHTLRNSNVVDLQYSHNGKIWVATFGGGVELLDPSDKSFEHVIGSTKNTTCLHDDGLGFLWMGTWKHGIRKLNISTGEIEKFVSYNILGKETVGGIYSDDHRDVWFSSDQGIYRFDRRMDTIFAYPALSGQYHFGASHQDDAGIIYFGGARGVVAFDPMKLSPKVSDPEVLITELLVFDEPVKNHQQPLVVGSKSGTDKVILKHDQSVLTIGFSVISLPFDGKINYAVQMENFDQSWRTIGSENRATYTNLPPGRYEFKVKSRLGNTPFGENYTSILIEIKKPLWATNVAYMLYAVLLILVLYFFRHYSLRWEKIKSQLKIEQVGREKDAELLNVKLRFFTNLSHEIRTPVTLILGSINRIVEKKVSGHIDEASLNHIKNNGTHLLNLVNELLDFRRMEEGNNSLKVVETDFVAFVREIFLSFYNLAEHNAISYDFKVEGEIPAVWLDEEQMEKVVYNLISNALKYTDSQGMVSVIISASDQAVFLTVKDSGRGISKSHLKRIFKPFYQSSKGEPPSGDGYGLGLAISHDIIKLHHGEIMVESEEGIGSQFVARIPLGIDHFNSEDIQDNTGAPSVDLDHSLLREDFSSSEQPDFSSFADHTVLVVEDNEGIREYLSDFLGRHFKVLQATHGQEALEMAFQEVPDIILTDVMMPVMDGVSFTKQIKKDPRTSHVPVIMLTARTSLIYKKEGLDIGADDYLNKPFSESLLKTRIKNLLLSRQRLREHYRREALIKPMEQASQSPDAKFLAKLKQLVEENLSEQELNAKFLAREIGMSQSNVYKKLKALTGLSLVEFTRDFRLQTAAELLVKQKLTVLEVCFKVGFSDRRYFSRIFKNKYGVNPSEYVKQHDAQEVD